MRQLLSRSIVTKVRSAVRIPEATMTDGVWKLAPRSVPVTDDDNCSSNGTDGSHSVHGGHSSHGTVLFLFAAFAVGGEPLLQK